MNAPRQIARELRQVDFYYFNEIESKFPKMHQSIFKLLQTSVNPFRKKNSVFAKAR